MTGYSESVSIRCTLHLLSYVWANGRTLSATATSGHQKRDQDEREGKAQEQCRQAIANLSKPARLVVLRGHVVYLVMRVVRGDTAQCRVADCSSEKRIARRMRKWLGMCRRMLETSWATVEMISCLRKMGSRGSARVQRRSNPDDEVEERTPPQVSPVLCVRSLPTLDDGQVLPQGRWEVQDKPLQLPYASRGMPPGTLLPAVAMSAVC